MLYQVGPSMGPSWVAKSPQQSLTIQLGRQKAAKRTPEASGSSFWTLRGGDLWGSPRECVSVAIVDPPVNDSVSRVSLPPSPLPPVYLPGFLPLRLPWRPRFPGSAGARVSAYNFPNFVLAQKSPPRVPWGWEWVEFAQKSQRNLNSGSKLSKHSKTLKV